MTRDERERLDDIWEAIQRIRKTVGSGRQTPEAEAVARDATLYNLVIIGEATKHLGEDPKAHHPEIPWRRIAGLGDLLTHTYFRIEMAAVRKIVDRDLGPLERAIAYLRGPQADPGSR